MTASRPGGAPPSSGLTLLCVGDTHVGSVPVDRFDRVIADTARLAIPNVAAVAQLGDGCDEIPSIQRADYIHFMDRLSVAAGAPWHNVMGNHDIQADIITPAQWAAAYGWADQSYVVDLPTLRLIFFSPSAAWGTYTQAPAAQLTWLDAQLGGTSNPCFVFCHFPLYGTVGGDPTVDYTSFMSSFFIRTAANNSSVDVTAVLAAHSNFKAWISGHTHSRVDAPDLVKREVAGSVPFAAINTSCIWYTGQTVRPTACLVHTFWLSWFGDRIEVRPRNVNTSSWASVGGRRVMTVSGL